MAILLLSCGIIRPHHSTVLVRPVVTDGVAWSVSWSVGLSVIIVSPAKLAESIEMLFGIWTQVGPRNHVKG